MPHILAMLSEQGVPTRSYAAAGTHCNQTELVEPQYRRLLEQLIDRELPPFLDDLTAKLSYAYFCQEYVRWSAGLSDVVLSEDVYPRATERAKTLIVRCPWMFSTDDDGTPNSTSSAAGSGGKKKGWKKIAALAIYKELYDADNAKKTKAQIMERYMSELDMSKVGATSYFYANRSACA